MWQISNILCLLVGSLLAITPAVFAFQGQDDESPGYEEMQYERRSQIWSRADVAYYDGSITTSPQDLVKLDQRVDTLVKAQMDMPVASSIALRPSFVALSTIRTEQDKEEPKTYLDETKHILKPAMTATMSMNEGIDIFAGGMLAIYPKYLQVTTNARGKAKRTYHAAYLPVLRMGVAKRAGNYGGGLFLSTKSERKRKIDFKSFDGSTYDEEDYVFEPIQFGVFGQTKFGDAHEAYAEIVNVQAAGGGEKDSNGNTIGEDFFVFRAKLKFRTAGSNFSICPGLTHQTKGYADQTYMLMDNLPTTSFGVDGLFGSNSSYAMIGLSYTQASAKQSTPEYSAAFKFIAYSLRLGLRTMF